MKAFVIILTLIISVSSSLVAQQFNKSYPSNLDLKISSPADVIELNNYYYKLETETNDTLNFHSNIRIIKADNTGNIIWSKRYDSGIDSSLIGYAISKTFDQKLIINSTIGQNNAFPTTGQSVFEIDSSGAIIWSVYFPDYSPNYSTNPILQLPDSSFAIASNTSLGLVTCILKLNATGTAVSAKQFANTSANFNLINCFHLRNNKLDFSLNYGDFIITDTAFTVLTTRKYQMDLTIPYFRGSTTANGDQLFISDQVAGGVGSGIARIFRTDSTGNLLWAKNITTWTSLTSHTVPDLFDVIYGIDVFEDLTGNIVATFLDEGSNCMIIKFDANGNYIMNRMIHSSALKECANGDLLYTSNNGTLNMKPNLVKTNFANLTACDSILDVQITNGTDSIDINPPTVITLPDTISLVPFLIHVTNTSVAPADFCTLTGIDQQSSADQNNLLIYPNPTSSVLHYQLKNDRVKIISLYNYLGERIPVVTHSLNEIDLSNVVSGIYFLQITTENKIISRKVIKE